MKSSLDRLLGSRQSRVSQLGQGEKTVHGNREWPEESMRRQPYVARDRDSTTPAQDTRAQAGEHVRDEKEWVWWQQVIHYIHT